MCRLQECWEADLELQESFAFCYSSYVDWSMRSGYSEKLTLRKRGEEWIWGNVYSEESLEKKRASLARLKERKKPNKVQRFKRRKGKRRYE